jgi:YggT family protein
MQFLANLLFALAKIVELTSDLLTAYKYLVVANAILSWVHADPYNPIVTFIYRLTEPLLRHIRRRMPDTGVIDFSPLVAFALIYFIQIFIFDSVVYYLIQYSSQLKLRG